MINKFIKIFSVVAALSLLLVLPRQAAAQYRVSGVVEFTYHSLDTKAGGSTVSSQTYWTQNYRANLSGDLWDPRFLKYTAGVGYTAYSYADSADSSSITYNVFTNFFPGRKVSWDLFSTRVVNTIDSSASIAGYDVTTTSFGGTLNLRLGRNRRNGNNNNNRNLNNNTAGLRLPDITITHIRTEAQSDSLINPLDETRDETRATIIYRPNPSVDLNLDGGTEKYRNAKNNASYDSTTLNLNSIFRISRDADLKLNGRFTDRTTQNFAGYNPQETNQAYSVIYDFREKQGLRHYYKYEFNELEYSPSDFTKHSAEAGFSLRSSESIQFRGRVDLSSMGYTRAPSGTDPGDKSSLDKGNLLGGASYRKKNIPTFIGPIYFESGYDLSVGYSRLVSETNGPEGGGMFYENAVNLGVGPEWEKETMSLNYSYSNKRDRSPMSNNIWQESYRLAISTKRIPRTSLYGSVAYITQQNRSEAGTVFTTASVFGSQQGINQERRSLTYDLTAAYQASAYLNLAVGASRGRSISNSYTLSTLTSTVNSNDEYYYGAANFNYLLTRNLFYRLQLREEYRATLASDTQSHQVNMYLDYRLRSIFVNLEYRWREEIPDNALRNMQQYFFAKISRPF